MYDPQSNDGITWHDLTAVEKLEFLINENAWYAGEMLAAMRKITTHKENIAIARVFVERNYRELWEHVHGNVPACSWPDPHALSELISGSDAY